MLNIVVKLLDRTLSRRFTSPLYDGHNNILLLQRMGKVILLYEYSVHYTRACAPLSNGTQTATATLTISIIAAGSTWCFDGLTSKAMVIMICTPWYYIVTKELYCLLLPTNSILRIIYPGDDYDCIINYSPYKPISCTPYGHIVNIDGIHFVVYFNYLNINIEYNPEYIVKTTRYVILSVFKIMISINKLG